MSDLQNDKSELRFVLLWHETPKNWERPSHFDLMIECDGSLETWELVADFCEHQTSFCRELPDHRKDYLDYEGPISNDRGEVSRHDSGPARWLTRSENHRSVELQGTRLTGHFLLNRGPVSGIWSFAKIASDESDEGSGTEKG